MKDLVSIIVPVYNIEDYVLKCLKSIANQTYKNIEVIVINDGSTDGSEKICNRFKKDKRFTIITTENHGLSAARNVGLKKATGKYLAFIDGDDFVEKEFIERMLFAAKENSADIVICGYYETYKTKCYEVSPVANSLVSGKEATINLLRFQENIDIVSWNKIYRRSLFKGIEYPEGRIFEDNMTTYKVIARAKSVLYIDEFLYTYCRRENSLSITASDIHRCEAREEAANEAAELFANDLDLLDAANYSKLLTWFKYVDFSLAGKINKSFFKTYRKKIFKHRKEMFNSQYLDRRRHMYIHMICWFKGLPYKIFRKIKH